MSARPLLRLASPIESKNPRRGLRRVPGAKATPPPHAFQTDGYVLWMGGVAVRAMRPVPGGWEEVAS